MECGEVRELLADYSVENLAEGAREQVEGHLRICAECRSHLAAFFAAGEMVERLESLEPPAEIWQKIQARGGKLFALPSERVAARRLRWAFASALVSVLMLILSITLSLHFFQPRLPEVSPALPMETVYQGRPSAPYGEMAGYFNEHAATSARDVLADPVSLGLVSFSETSAPEERK